MNITKKRLTQIIKEEISRVNEVDASPKSVTALALKLQQVGKTMQSQASKVKISQSEAQMIFALLDAVLGMASAPNESKHIIQKLLSLLQSGDDKGKPDSEQNV